jgi:hypothetical protein
MSSISDCPSCGRKVSIPADLDPATPVRCPLCEAEFPLDRALAAAVAIPPELVPVARISAESPNGLTLFDEDSEQLAEQPAEHVDASAGIGAGIAAGTPDDVYTLQGEPPAKAEDEDEAERYDFGDGPAVGGAGLGIPGAAALRRSRQEEPSLVVHLVKFIGIAVCGLLGIAVAYLALSLISPTHFDYLNVLGRAKKPSPDGKLSAPNGEAPAKSAERNPNDPWADLK